MGRIRKISIGFYGKCPSCGSMELTWDANPTYYDKPEGTKGIWQSVIKSGTYLGMKKGSLMLGRKCSL
jgi:hypothetical protein